MAAAPHRVLHVIRPEEKGSIGGADLHVLDLCVAQNEIGAYRASILALGASEDFLRRARQLDVELDNSLILRPRRWRRLGALPHVLGADLIHAHGYEADYTATLMPCLARTWRALPRVITCHGLIAPDIRHRVMSALDMRCMRRADALIAVAIPSRVMLRQILSDLPIYVIANGVPPPTVRPEASHVRALRAELGVHGEGFLIGYVGRLSREKRPDLFLQAAELLADEHPEARFVYVGGGVRLQAIQRAAAGSPVADKVGFAGVRRDMDTIYAALDALVVPSDIEGTSRVITEAQMRSLPVVATAVGGTPELIKDGESGLLVPAGKADAIACALATVISDIALRQRIVGLGAHTAMGRTAQKMARAVTTVYEAVCTDVDSFS